MDKPEMTKCPVPGCVIKMLRSQAMCIRHWFQVPADLRALIWESYDAGRQGTKDHFGLVVRAVRGVYEREKAAERCTCPVVCSDLLGLVSVVTTPEECAKWTEQQRDEAMDWAGAVHASASDNAGVVIPPKPSHLPEEADHG